MKIALQRDYLGTDCSQGRLIVGAEVFETMERPWVPVAGAPCGKKGASCVPVGVYQLARHNSEAHPNTWALVNPDLWVYHWDEDVPVGQFGIARTLVLLHSANRASELRGCIAPGMGRYVESSGVRTVTQSKAAMSRIRQLLPYGPAHTIEIA